MPRNSNQWPLLGYSAQSLKEEIRKKQNIITISKFFLFLFDSNDVNATSFLSKITVTGDGSNNSGVWGRSPQPPEANGGLGAEPQRCSDFPVFSKKYSIFMHILV